MGDEMFILIAFIISAMVLFLITAPKPEAGLSVAASCQSYGVWW